MNVGVRQDGELVVLELALPNARMLGALNPDQADSVAKALELQAKRARAFTAALIAGQDKTLDEVAKVA